MMRARLAWLRDEPGRDLAPLAARLGPGEAADLARLDRADLRRGFLLSRALLRKVLADVSGAAGQAPRFARAPSGRLLLEAPAGWHVSLSHTDGLVAVVAATAPCGVDIERVRDARVAAVAARYFAPEEAAQLAAVDAATARRDFFRLWTLKEAAVKALGEGLAGNMARLAFTLAPEGPRQAFAEPALALWQHPLAEAWLAAAVVTPTTVEWCSGEARLTDLGV